MENFIFKQTLFCFIENVFCHQTHFFFLYQVYQAKFIIKHEFPFSFIFVSHVFIILYSTSQINTKHLSKLHLRSPPFDYAYVIIITGLKTMSSISPYKSHHIKKLTRRLSSSKPRKKTHQVIFINFQSLFRTS